MAGPLGTIAWVGWVLILSFAAARLSNRTQQEQGNSPWKAHESEHYVECAQGKYELVHYTTTVPVQIRR